MTIAGETVTGNIDAGLDAADRLILDEASALLPGAIVVVVGSAALAAAAHDLGAAEVRVSDDADPTSSPLESALFADAAVVLLRLPKSLAALGHVATMIAASAPAGVVLVSGGRLKYMTIGMNEVLLRSFARLDVSLARQKSRVLTAREPIAATASDSIRKHDDELDLWVSAVGGVFAGASVDIGTRTLLSVFGRLPEYASAIDFGCGTGVLAVVLKRRRPSARVLASDISAEAVQSARETAAENEIEIEVARDDLLSGQPDASVDLILLNPPFHDAGALSTDTAAAMFVDAARVLRPGGQLWTVFNSHLGYAKAIESAVGVTTQVTHNAKFTVTASTKAVSS